MPPKKRSRGRPSLPGSAKLIRLRESVYDLWRARKTTMGFGNTTDSAFAEILLHCSHNGTGDSGEIFSSVEGEQFPSTSVFVNDYSNGLPAMSTPVRADGPVPKFASPSKQIGTSSAVFDSFVDITGDPEKSRLEVFAQTNHSLAGNPFSVLCLDQNDSTDSDNASEAAESVLVISALDNHQFPELEQSMSVILEELHESDMSSEEGVEEHSDIGECNLSENETYETTDGTQHFNEAACSMDISSEEDERTLTMIDPLYGSQSNEDECVPGDEAGPQPEEEVGEGSKSAEKNKDKILKKLEKAFSMLTDVKDLKAYLALHSRTRVIVSINKLVELSTDTCALESGGKVCGEVLCLTQDVTSIGSRVEITRKCRNGHHQKWISSEVLGAKHNSDFYLNDYLLAAAIIISGNNFSKFALLCKALGLSIISSNTFTRFQKHCAAPVISDVWNKMNGLIVDILKQYEEICLCGDGRNDSPGHSARYCVYTLMEHATKVVVDMAVIDKRETGGNSVTMEKEGLRRLLEKMATVLPFSEITTDASSSIMKLVREMKGTLVRALSNKY
ncbi:uncharacterized protein [Montipora foliosa]|uniref:uncharacterized protein isoform X1 n=1 Tax=Montipora foliosa TaxID=591990 RepID=UPI0035F14946